MCMFMYVCDYTCSYPNMHACRRIRMHVYVSYLPQYQDLGIHLLSTHPSEYHIHKTRFHACRTTYIHENIHTHTHAHTHISGVREGVLAVVVGCKELRVQHVYEVPSTCVYMLCIHQPTYSMYIYILIMRVCVYTCVCVYIYIYIYVVTVPAASWHATSFLCTKYKKAAPTYVCMICVLTFARKQR
jgi:hypothetical protein